jgi:hypothetical protein
MHLLLMHSDIVRFLGALSVAIPLAWTGCGSKISTYPVTGTVRFEDGSPVPVAAVEFRHEESGLSARTKVDATGAFSLGTFATDDGALAGNYQVIVTQYFSAPPRTARVRMAAGHVSHDAGADVRIAAEVGDFSTSPLRAEVRPDSKNHFDFVVKRFRPRKLR